MIDVIRQLEKYSDLGLSDRERLDLLLGAKRAIDDEIKNLSTNGKETYANLLRLKIANIVFGQEFESERDILWSPDKHAEYMAVRKKITDELGNLGKIITKSQYEKAINILSNIK